MGDIYFIEHVPSGRRYIGKTGGSYHVRCRRHMGGLRNNNHSNRYLQNTFNKHGPAAFVSGSLVSGVECPELLSRLETEFILASRSFVQDNGFNLTIGGEGASCANVGKRHSDVTKRRMSETKIGIPKSDETRKRMSVAQRGNKKALGNTHTAESRKRMSESSRGKPKSEEHRVKIAERMKASHPMKGRTHSNETRDKISEAKRGKPKSEEHRKKLSAARSGVPWTEARRNAQTMRKKHESF